MGSNDTFLKRMIYDCRVEAIFRHHGNTMVGEKVRVQGVRETEFEGLVVGEELTISSVSFTDSGVVFTVEEYEGDIDIYYNMFYNTESEPLLELVNFHQLYEDVCRTA